jgi:hypothetical protein
VNIGLSGLGQTQATFFSFRISQGRNESEDYLQYLFGRGEFSETFPNQDELIMKECRERKRKK